MSGSSSRGGRGRPAAAAIRKIVLAAQILVLAAGTYGFLTSDLRGDAARALVASWQAFPGLAEAARAAIDAASFGAASAAFLAAALSGFAIPIILLSAIFGRWHCAFLCPLGALQGAAASIRRGGRRYRGPATLARAAAAVAALGLAFAGAMAAASWLDPWSLFGRFVSYDIRPFVQMAARADAHGFGAWTALPIAAAIAAMLLLSARSKSRWFCGFLCPVGSLLGALNSIAPLRFRLDQASCVSCGNCLPRCPAACIDVKAKRIDAGRCLSCAACAAACPNGAIYYGPARRKSVSANAPVFAPGAAPLGAAPPAPGMSRAAFLAALGGGASVLALAAIPGRKAASSLGARPNATVPPGAVSVERFIGSCTACGLCVAACPSSVLLPSLGELGPRALLAPVLDFSVSYCQYECVSCMTVCPSGALRKIPLEEKKLVKIGTASLVKEHCVVFTDKTKCGACAEHCPTGAVRMVDAPTGIPEPVFDSSICVGCGACHHICPVPGKAAISVAGLPAHERAKEPSDDLFGGEDPAQIPRDEGEFPF